MAKGKKDGKASPKRKQPKDPNAPKRPQSAYFLWMNANRENIKKDLGLDKVDIGKIGKEAGRRWGEMTADDKKEWEEKANQDKVRYEREKASYDASRVGGGLGQVM